MSERTVRMRTIPQRGFLKLLNVVGEVHKIMKYRAERSLQYSIKWDAVRKVTRNHNKLDNQAIKKCREYAIEIFGDETYTFELARYYSIHGSWRDGWIPESWFHQIIVRGNAGRLSTLSREKTLSNYFFQSNAFPDLAYYANGRFYTNDWRRLERDEAKDFIFEGRDRIVFKQNASMRGRGIQTFTKSNFNPADFSELGSGCFQRYIKVCETVPTFGVESVPTLRVVTTLDSLGKVTTRFAYFRLGRSGQSHVISDDSVRIAVCIESGELSDTGYLADWTPLQAHPETGIPFHGTIYPEIKKALEICIQHHEKVPTFVSIGWDVCLNMQGDFNIMEWNQLHGIEFGEAVNGPNFSDLNWERATSKSLLIQYN